MKITIETHHIMHNSKVKIVCHACEKLFVSEEAYHSHNCNYGKMSYDCKNESPPLDISSITYYLDDSSISSSKQESHPNCHRILFFLQHPSNLHAIHWIWSSSFPICVKVSAMNHLNHWLMNNNQQLCTVILTQEQVFSHPLAANIPRKVITVHLKYF